MNADYKTAQMMFADMIREADQRRLQKELISAAEAYNQRENHRGIVQRIVQRLHTGKPQETVSSDGQRAHAV